MPVVVTSLVNKSHGGNVGLIRSVNLPFILMLAPM